jgi:Fe-Mn family superoxide dismutase
MKKLEQRANLITKKILKEDSLRDQNLLLTEMKKIGIEKLPYSYSALKKFIDSKTMDVHYNKHYKGYVEKLNKALKKKDYGDLELEQIVKSIGRFNVTVRNNAGGAFNHAMFWKMLSPKKQTLSGDLLEKIKKDFGTYEKFKKEFEQVAKDRFGSGWVWLILTKRNKLKIVSTPNQDNPLMSSDKDGGYPILGLDLWEHAYYLKYQNKRDEYIQNFWDVVNWEFVSNLYKLKTDTKLKESVVLKNILSENKNGSLDEETNEAVKFIFNKNDKVKSIFKNSIDTILESVFVDKWYGRDEYESNTLPGVYDFESNGRSLVNKMSSDHNSFALLLKHANRLLEKENKERIEIIGVPYNKQINETVKFVSILEENKSELFNIKSPTFRKLLTDLVSHNK